MKVKDLVTTGIFSALLVITVFIGGGPFAVNPVLTFYMPVGAALLGGPVFLLLLAKVPKRGSVLTAGILAAIILFVTGMHWAMSLGYLVMGLAADVMAGLKQYRRVSFNIAAYLLFCLGGTGTYIVYFINPASWNRLMLAGGTDSSYLDSMGGAVYSFLPVVLIGGTLTAALLSGLFGKRLLRRQFERAGITV